MNVHCGPFLIHVALISRLFYLTYEYKYHSCFRRWEKVTIASYLDARTIEDTRTSMYSGNIRLRL